MTDDVDVAAIQARADAATPGPWTTRADGADGFYTADDYYDIDGADDATVAYGGAFEDGGPHVGACSRVDAEFIAHARTDVPALLAENVRLEADLAVAVHEATTTRAAAAEISDEAYRVIGFLDDVDFAEHQWPTLHALYVERLAALSSTNTTHEEQQ